VVSISVLIVTQGREELLIKCLDSLQSELKDFELIILANGSELSPETLSHANKASGKFILLQSDTVLTPGKARNVAIESATGEWVFFIDDDAYLIPGYRDIADALLNEEKIEIFGGPDSPAKGMNAFSYSLSLALSSPFCTGNTFGRHKSFGSKLLLVDEEKLTSCNLWIRKSVLSVFRFPEEYKRAEETVLLQKLRKEGKNLFYHPKLKVAHYRRTNIIQLLRPTFSAGYFRSRLMKEKLKNKNDAFWLPAFFVLLHTLIFFEPEVFWYLARMYASIILLVSISLAMKAHRFLLFPLIAFLHYFVVFMYGLGFITERIGRIKS
jgi:succinoglycan biosynthesis protein ExoA